MQFNEESASVSKGVVMVHRRHKYLKRVLQC